MNTQTEIIVSLQALVLQQGAAIEQARAMQTTVGTLQDTIAALEDQLAAAAGPGLAPTTDVAPVLPELAALVAQLGAGMQVLVDALQPPKLPPVVDVPAETQ